MVFDFEPNINGITAPHGHIHSETVVRRLEAIDSKEELISMLRSGVKFKLKSDDINFEDYIAKKNNQSALDDLKECQSTVLKWEREGYVERCSREQVDVINPLSLSYKHYPVKGKTKKRLCLDCSKISKVMDYRSIKLPDPKFIADHILPDSWLFSVNYESW